MLLPLYSCTAGLWELGLIGMILHGFPKGLCLRHKLLVSGPLLPLLCALAHGAEVSEPAKLSDCHPV